MITKKIIYNLLKKRVLILDGATGTQLQKIGMPAGVCPEKWCVENSDAISSIHKAYANAGSDIIYTATFGANRLKLNEYGIKDVAGINRKLAAIAKKSAARENVFVAGDIGPTGKFVAPFGDLPFEEAVDIFKEQVRGLLKGGVDLFVIETMMDIQEARAALLAVKETCDKFVMVSLTYEKDGRTLAGTDPLTALITLQSLGADAVGLNCSTGPREMLDAVSRIRPYAKIFLFAKPNAGLPRLKDGKTVFDMDVRQFASCGAALVRAGANMLGGCCGTDPEYIKNLVRVVKSKKPFLPLRKSISALSSGRGNIIFGRDEPFCVVGECINPTGKKDFAKELAEGKFDILRRLARDQQAAGAKVLDVNVGAGGIDEVKAMREALSVLSLATELPLAIDSSKVEVIAQALRLYPGRALINSISAEKDKLSRLLPLAAKYGAMFILLPLTSSKIPYEFSERKKIASAVLAKALKYGFTKDDIVVDGLAMTVSSKPHAGIETLKTIGWASGELGCQTIIGLSNVSFGLPKRQWLNAAYLAMAAREGLSMAIANPLNAELMNAVRSADVLLVRDVRASEYIKHFTVPPAGDKKNTDEVFSPGQRIKDAILEGEKREIKDFIALALDKKISAQNILNDIMIPAITEVGRRFETKHYFLPQLIAGAEAMKEGLNYLEPILAKQGGGPREKVNIILATVKGDIHDIGKNIVALILKNHGFNVIDLGKDAGAQKIVARAKKMDASLIGLSALMTTTMVNMKEVIDLAKKEGLSCKVIIGGAVVTKAYADSLGVSYAKDGVEAVRVIKGLMNSK
jgi:5-methyltetrahydrofolate--homocysteine methyltransferase